MVVISDISSPLPLATNQAKPLIVKRAFRAEPTVGPTEYWRNGLLAGALPVALRSCISPRQPVEQARVPRPRHPAPPGDIRGASRPSVRGGDRHLQRARIVPYLLAATHSPSWANHRRPRRPAALRRGGGGSGG